MAKMQALIDGMSAEWQRERAAEQLTLGGLISALEAMPQSSLIDGIEEPHSYRGYYCDLAFEKVEKGIMVSDALTMCKSAMGKVFEGYKGGDYVMGELTPIWMAYYGDCGERIMSISDKGKFLTEE